MPDHRSFPTTAAGIGQAIAWMKRTTNGNVLAAIEGTSSYGAGPSRALRTAGTPEVKPPGRQAVRVSASPIRVTRSRLPGRRCTGTWSASRCRAPTCADCSRTTVMAGYARSCPSPDPGPSGHCASENPFSPYAYGPAGLRVVRPLLYEPNIVRPLGCPARASPAVSCPKPMQLLKMLRRCDDG